MFDLRAARYFLAVAEELHFGRAAERLQMSQPPLSQAIRALEADVGTPLFTRTNRHVALTPAGAAFVPECRRLLTQAAAATETPRLAAAGMRARVVIGAVASAMVSPLPAALKHLSRRAPHIDVRIEEIDTHEAVEKLHRGEIDLALARLSANRIGVTSTVLIRDTFTLLLPETHPQAHTPGPLDLSAFANDSWIWLDRRVAPDYHDDMSAACRAVGFTPTPTHIARSIASQIALVDCGVGITIIPSSISPAAPRAVHPKALAHEPEAIALTIATRNTLHTSEQLVQRILQDAIANPTS